MKVSVLTLINNRVDLFTETVASVLNQSYPIYELIVIDDGSIEDVKKALDKFNDDRIKYFRYERIGVISKLRNLALKEASGEAIAFIDSDDLWHRDKIKLHVEDMVEKNSFISFSDCQLFDINGPIGKPVCLNMNKENVNVFKELTERNQSLAFGSNLFFRNTNDNILFDEKLFVGEHDFITLMSAVKKTTYIDYVLNYIRRHDRNVSKRHSKMEIIAPLEHNKTTDKLYAKKLITKKLQKKIKAENYIKIGYSYLERGVFKKSIAYTAKGLLLNPKFNYFKIFLKTCLVVLGLQKISISAN